MMLEVTDRHIASLNDTDLRTLVGRLCEAELRLRGISPAAVTYGGDQRAKDGGLDVRVELPPNAAIDGFIPRSLTGFQVKATNMPASEIKKEMKPSGSVRPVICELAKAGGAYIIISSMGATSDSALKSRVDTMTKSINEIDDASSLKVDFYDRRRIETWVRGHPGLAVWVRQQIGLPVRGWRPYEAWALDPKGLEGEYLVDDSVRLRRSGCSDKALKIADAITEMRASLRMPRSILRLVGLSGVGKTRLVQALFDERIAASPLDSSAAIYTDMSDEPDPQPIGMVSDLIANRSMATIIVDNCSADLHRRLSQLCRAHDSNLSLLTVEYDVRDDEPEGTDVFVLEPSSAELTERLIIRRYPAVSEVDARTVAVLSGGNARVAIALASMIREGDAASGVKEEELFRRLFQQKHQHDQSLLLAAQACSLVYSFQGTDLDGELAELPRLSALVGIKTNEIFRHVAELCRRQLAQKRGEWRAILPHAIANRLAASALQNIPYSAIEDGLVNGAPPRLFKSFSRRIGYLHDSKEAVEIARRWLAEDGLLGNPADLNNLGASAFINVAPAAPKEALIALDRSFISGSPRVKLAAKPYTQVIRAIAYDPENFEQCISLLARFASVEEDSNDSGRASSVMKSLFYVALSGTHASVEQRLRSIASLFQIRHSFGADALKAALKTSRFSSSYHFDFGSRSRDHGFWPNDEAEICHWFTSVLKFVRTILEGKDQEVGCLIRAAIAERFRDLWGIVGIQEELAELCRQISSNAFWGDGWVAVKQTIRRDSKMEAASMALLKSLEESLRPRTLADKIHSIVLAKSQSVLEFAMDDPENPDSAMVAHQKTNKLAQELGEETARDASVFKEMLPHLFQDRERLFYFGRGLARTSQKPTVTWQELVSQLSRLPKEQRGLRVLRGYLESLMDTDSTAANDLLDQLVADPILDVSFPFLQAVTQIDERAVGRLLQALAHGKAPIREYIFLAHAQVCKSTPEPKFRELIRVIASEEDGVGIAADIVSMRLFSEKQDKTPHGTEILGAARDVLGRVRFRHDGGDSDYHIGSLIEAGLRGASNANAAIKIARDLRRAVGKHETGAFQHSSLLVNLFKVQTLPVLDALFTGNVEEVATGIELISDMSDDRANPMDSIAIDDLLSWASVAPVERFPILASTISFCHRQGEKAQLQWSDGALRMLRESPDTAVALEPIIQRFTPHSWSGSRATVVEEYLELLLRLKPLLGNSVSAFIENAEVRLRKFIEQQRRLETEHDRSRDERFE